MPQHIRKEGEQHERQAPIARERFKHGKALRGLTILAALIGMPCSSNSQTPADDVAAQVRSQGYRCDRPITAVRDVRHSKPDSSLWVLKCRNAAYRVRLDPDMAAHVTIFKKLSR
jgi:hypothetical protein